MKIFPLAWVKLSKNNLIHNIKQFRNLANRNTKFSVAIKGNAYGHGQNEVAKILEPYVDYFQINSINELELLRKITKKPVLLLGYIQESDLLKVIKLECILSVFSLEQIERVSAIAETRKKIQKIHLPVDAYLGREGFLLQDLPNLFAKIKKYKFIELSGIYAHFANIENATNFSHAQKQIEEYQRALVLAEKFGFKNPPRLGEVGLQTHLSATSGLLVYEKNLGINNIIRLGIGAYGMWPSEHLMNINKDKIILKPVLSWKTKIAQIKILPKGRTIGYGLTYKTKKKTKIAIIPQGYADGFDRNFSNNGFVLIGGARCKILGRVSMNMFAVDVTHLNKIKPEDEVVILGRQGREEITAEEMAERINTINYEITTRISSLLPRVIV